MKLNPIQQDGNKPAFKAQLILKNNIKFNQPHYKSLKSYVSNIGKKSDIVTIAKDKINIIVGGNKKEAKLNIFDFKADERVEKIKETIKELLAPVAAATAVATTTVVAANEKSENKAVVAENTPSVVDEQRTTISKGEKLTAPVITKEDLAKIQLTFKKDECYDIDRSYFIRDHSEFLTNYEPQAPFVKFNYHKTLRYLDAYLKNLTPNGFEIKFKDKTQIYKIENGNFTHPELDEISQFEDVQVNYFDDEKLVIRAFNKNMQPILSKDLYGGERIVFPYKDYEISLTEGSKIVMSGAYSDAYTAELKNDENGRPIGMIVKSKDAKDYGDVTTYYNVNSDEFIQKKVKLKHPYFNKVLFYKDGKNVLSSLQFNNADGKPGFANGTYVGKKSLVSTLDFIKENKAELLNFKTIKDSDIKIKPSTFNTYIHNELKELLDYNLPRVVELIRSLGKIEGDDDIGYAYNLTKQGIVKEKYELSHWGYEGGKRWDYIGTRGVVCPVTWKGDIANINGFDYDPQKGTISFNKGNTRFVCVKNHNASRLDNYGGAAIVEQNFVENGLNVNVKQEVINKNWATLTETHKDNKGEIVAFNFTMLKRTNPEERALNFRPVETIRKEINSDDIIISTDSIPEVRVTKEDFFQREYSNIDTKILTRLIEELEA